MSIKPRLGLFDLTMIIVSLVIGIGIFRTPTIVAQKAGTPFIFFTAWILGGVISICGALTFAEIGSRYPTAGGFYKIFSYCFHPAYAFMLNWALVITNSASAVGVAVVGAEYINPVLLPPDMQTPANIKITALVVTLVLYALNFLGIRTGRRTQNLLSSIKILMMLAFCFAVFAPHQQAGALPVTESSYGFITALGVSLISIFFTYGGYQNTINFGADVEQPEKNMPRGILFGIGIVIALYLTINLAYYLVLGFGGIQHSNLLAADMASAFLGSNGGKVASVVIFISVLGFINTSLMSNPRVYYAMAEDKILPPIFKRVNDRTMAQEFALSFFVLLMILSLFLLGAVEKIINYVMFIDSLSLVSAAATLFVFRKRGTGGNVGYRIKWYPFIPILFMAVLFVVTINVVVSDWQSALYGAVIFLLGYPIYRVMKVVVSN